MSEELIVELKFKGRDMTFAKFKDAKPKDIEVFIDGINIKDVARRDFAKKLLHLNSVKEIFDKGETLIIIKKKEIDGLINELEKELQP